MLVLVLALACATPPTVGAATSAQGICLEMNAASCWCDDPACLPAVEAASVCGSLDPAWDEILLAMLEDWQDFAPGYVDTCEW